METIVVRSPLYCSRTRVATCLSVLLRMLYMPAGLIASAILATSAVETSRGVTPTISSRRRYAVSSFFQFVFWLRMVLIRVLKGSSCLGVHLRGEEDRARAIASSALVFGVRVAHYLLGVFHGGLLDQDDGLRCGRLVLQLLDLPCDEVQ